MPLTSMLQVDDVAKEVKIIKETYESILLLVVFGVEHNKMVILGHWVSQVHSFIVTRFIVCQVL